MTETNFTQALWQAVINRDRCMDGVFYYAVLSTGIFCRPSCSSRNPKPENIRFYRLASLAEKAGFRACKKCRPERVDSKEPEVERAEKLCRMLEQSLEEKGALETFAENVGLSPDHLRKSFKTVVGLSPKQYSAALKKGRLQEALREIPNVAQAIYEAGYGSSSRVYEKGDSLLGMSPATYAKGGRGAEIVFEIKDSPFGRLLVAATEQGICHLSLGEDDHLIAELHKDFPKAQIKQGEGRLKGWIGDILTHLDGRLPHLTLPLDIRATAFQAQVWQALQKIPFGETQSYKEIALSLGKPKSARAVGRACASNPVSLVIPCHRAVGSGGSLTGYRWGIERKAALLEHEEVLTAGAKNKTSGQGGE